MGERRIFKYRIPDGPGVRLPAPVMIPKGATVLSVGLQESAEDPPACVVWADVDLSAPSVPRRIFGLWTGATPPAGGRFVGTTTTAGGEYVVHVYDLGEASHG